MKRNKLIGTVVVVSGCLLAALALVQAARLVSDQGDAAKQPPGSSSDGLIGSSTSSQTTSSSSGKSSQDGELKDPMLRAFGQALTEADDLEHSDRSEAWKILKEADPILTRVKAENRKALERAKHPPRLVREHDAKRQPSRDTPESPGQQQPKR